MGHVVSFDDFMRGTVASGPAFKFVSIFSGAGLGDYGFHLAGGNCLAACEIEPQRRFVHKRNLHAPLWGDIRVDSDSVVEACSAIELDVLMATPPCQGFSTANAQRGRRDCHRPKVVDATNSLFFEAVRVAAALKPKVVVFENVPNFLDKVIRKPGGRRIATVERFLSEGLPGYACFTQIDCLSRAGVPQRRKRVISIYARRDVVDCPERWRRALHIDNWLGALRNVPGTVHEALARVPVLDGAALGNSADPSDQLHCVPEYSDRHYSWIASIPPGSGLSAWDNPCPKCGDRETARLTLQCRACGALIDTRPHVVEDGRPRSIRGYRTSYRRMKPNELAPTVTTASGHFSSDLKLHYAQNRVLSPRECAILQTVPASFVWPAEQFFKKKYLVREMIGEAVPPLVTYRLGLTLANLIASQ
jgi:DNA (cytosine-5)-methyltransferase 1